MTGWDRARRPGDTPGVTMTAKTGGLKLEAFEVLLETYGADRERWPADQRTLAAELMAANAGARALFLEAEALDRVLAGADGCATVGPANASDALVNRIMQAALAERPPTNKVDTIGAPESGVVVPLPRPKPHEARATPPAKLNLRRFGGWQAAAVLVLALLTGVAIGSADFLAVPLTGLADLVGIDTDTTQSVAALQLDGLPWVMDEEQL